VPDLDQAVSFFRDVLGAELLFRFEEGPGTENPADLQKTLGVDPNSKLNIAMMRLGPNLNLELMDYRTPGQNRSIPKTSDVDVAHIAFWVDDMEVAAKYLRKRGCRLLEGPFKSDRGPKAGQQIRYFTTPWGMAMEILHRPPNMPYEKDTQSRLFGPISD
jgi:catechol 2,3-dioxygenase-like lactoylglutathione lyase family enzyme